MKLDLDQIQKALCQAMCSQVRVTRKNEKLAIVDTPFFFADGDPYQMYLKEQPGGVIRLSDMGHTLMHLSYDNDIDAFRDGTRGNLLQGILAETDVHEENGEFYVDTPTDGLAKAVFRLGQALTKVNDLTFLSRHRAESTFYEDLQAGLMKVVPPDKIQKNYYEPGIEHSSDYPIDYRIQTKHDVSLFVFGIPNRDKARLVTIVLERLLRAHVDFDSLLIFQDQTALPKPDIARLSNAGGEMIASLDAQEDFSRKLLRKVG